MLDEIRNADFVPQRKLAESQLGTVGSGNHYVNVMADEDGRVWAGVHFGSRGFGHRTASRFLALAQGLAFDAKAHEGEMDSPPVLFEVANELGDAYVAPMALAGEYADAGGHVVVDKVLEILGAGAVHEGARIVQISCRRCLRTSSTAFMLAAVAAAGRRSKGEVPAWRLSSTSARTSGRSRS